MIDTRERVFSNEKINRLQTLEFNEQLRQQEVASEKAKSEEERKQNIQYALIAIVLVTLIILFLFLSRSFITNTKLISFFGVIALLLVFEFLNLILHPFLERITHHSPILMLLALVCIAALLVPLHHKIEKWITVKLVEKNKATRLANAKKTIEKLEDKINDTVKH
jgi:NADH:ubiquinone oxidoreductase subunit 3 (subunit A)